jgi:hypothetical protein
MDNNSQILAILYSMAWSLPFLLLYLVGIILSVVFRKRLGKIWLAPIFAFLLHILGNVISLAVQVVLNYYMLHSSDYSAYSTIAWISGVVTVFLHILADILLLIALFARRGNEIKV